MSSIIANATLIQFNGLNQLIPDGNSSGYANQQSLNLGNIGNITEISVRLELTGVNGGGYNGDLYAWLQHDTGFSVLLNRPGRSASDSTGYGDNGMNVLFNDGAANDIHSYREILAGPFPLLTPLGGIWRPDGRNVDPGNVVTTDPRPSTLQSMIGGNPNGDWTLFVADLESGGEVQLRSWALDIRTDVQNVPESMHTLWSTVAVFGLMCYVRNLRDKNKRPI